MNKKIIVLILTIFCVAATIVISVFGKVPEDSSRVPVAAIMFVDNTTEDGLCERNEEGDKLITIEKGTTQYQLQWLINPTEASDKSVSFQIVNGSEYSSVSETGLVSFMEEFAITVKIYSNALDGKTDIVIIEFGGGNSSIIPDDEDPFA